MKAKTLQEIFDEFEKECGPIDYGDDEPEDFDEGQV